MRREFELSRRSRLKPHTSELGGVIATLAANPQARNDFLRDPAAFLNQHRLPVDACTLGMAADFQTMTTDSATASVYVYGTCSGNVNGDTSFVADMGGDMLCPGPVPVLEARPRH